MKVKAINEMEFLPYKIRCLKDETDEVKGSVFNYGGERFGVDYRSLDYWVISELRSGGSVITGHTKEIAIQRLKERIPISKLHERIMKFDDLNPDIKPKITLRQTKSKKEEK